MRIPNGDRRDPGHVATAEAKRPTQRASWLAPASLPSDVGVSILIPCLNEEGHIERVVRQALGQRHPRHRLEVLVADGGSRDGTRRILEKLRREDDRLTVIDNPMRIQSAGLNALIGRSNGEVLVRMDAHCDYPDDYVWACLDALRRTDADNVGGPQRMVGVTPFQLAVVDAMQSPLAMGGAAFRDPTRRGWVDTVFLGAFRRRVFERVGLYDARAVTNEDAELNQRILADGGRIWLSPDIVSRYHPRETSAALARQYFRYGHGRARTLLKHRRAVSLRPLLPFAALTTAVVLALSGSPLVLALAATYASVTAVEAWRVASALPFHGRVIRAGRVATIFATLHAMHALGFAAGLIRYAVRADWEKESRLAPVQATDASES